MAPHSKFSLSHLGLRYLAAVLLVLALSTPVIAKDNPAVRTESETVPAAQPALTSVAKATVVPATTITPTPPLPPVPPAPATAEVKIVTRAGTHPTFERIVFDTPRSVAYVVQREGTKVTITFPVAAKMDLRPLTKAKLTRARDFTTDGTDKLAVHFVVDEKAVIKDFISDSAIVIDVMGANTVAAPNEPKVPPSLAVPIVEPKATVETTKTPIAEAKPTEATPAAAPSPAAAPTTPVEQNQAVAPVVNDEVSPKAGPALVPVAAAPAPLAPAAQIIEASSSEIIRPVLETVPKTKKPDLEIGFTPELVATLDPGTVTGAAIFTRGGYGYILFDRKLIFDLAALSDKKAPKVALELIDLRRTNGFRFVMPEGAEIRATRTDSAWQIYLSKQRNEISVSTALVAQPDFALGARMILPVPDAPEPVRFTDPVIGDDLIAVPLLETQAFNIPRHMADFAVVPSAQGLVIKPRHEKVTVRAVSDGVEITAIGGLRLSRSNDTGASQQSANKAKAAAAGKSVFDFAGWGSKPNETFTTTRQRLMQSTVDVPEAEKNRARLDLARLYFASGMGQEAVSLLNFLAQLVPDLPTHPEFMALRGAAHILANHPNEGLRDLSDSQLTYQPEIELWQAVAAAQLRDWATAEEKFNLTEGVLASYPEPFYSHFAVLAIEAAIAMDKDREAAEWLDRLEAGAYRSEIGPAMEYLRGVMQSKTGRSELAEVLWRSVAKSSDRLYKTRAELALVDLGVATNSLTPIQAAERLEGLRYAWRGDDLELDILHRLGNFYVEAKRFREGLTILGQAVRLYPDSPMTVKVREEMGVVFHDIFLGNVAENMTPVEALTLYQDFRELMPPGEDGKAVTRNLAERLVAIDLLDQAAGLLESQVKNSLQGEEKAKVGTRLAAIRLLDHNADAALAALDLSQVDGMSAALQNERLLLRARALSEQKKGDEALELLKGSDSQPARLLRADITMRAERWSAAVIALQELIGPPPGGDAKLTEEQAQWLVDCAIALSLANDVAGLDKLAIDFGAPMSITSQKDTFRILTRPEKTGQMRDIAAAQARLAEVDMFQSFLENYRAGEDKKLDDKKTDGKKAGDKKAEDKKPENKKTGDVKTDDKKSEDKNAEPAKQ